MADRGDRIRLLATGFTPFPGAPVNPTEHLMRHFMDNPPDLGAGVDMRFAVLPVSYSGAIPALEEAAGEFDPHIAVHFGLAAQTPGFRLERTARNEIASSNPDNEATVPTASCICDGAGHHPSTLPLADIHVALSAHNLPVVWSDDAGGYLCNYVFYHSAGGLCRNIRAAMSGFIHVGPVDPPGASAGASCLDFRNLVEGAEIIMRSCIRRLK
jgi:pyroglutamyl-peptidase